MFRFRGVTYVNVGNIDVVLTLDQFFLDGGSLSNVENQEAVFMSSEPGDADRVYWTLCEKNRGLNDPYPFLCKGCHNDTMYYVAGVCPQEQDVSDFLREFAIYCVEDVVV